MDTIHTMQSDVTEPVKAGHLNNNNDDCWWHQITEVRQIIKSGPFGWSLSPRAWSPTVHPNLGSAIFIIVNWEGHLHNN